MSRAVCRRPFGSWSAVVVGCCAGGWERRRRPRPCDCVYWCYFCGRPLLACCLLLAATSVGRRALALGGSSPGPGIDCTASHPRCGRWLLCAGCYCCLCGRRRKGGLLADARGRGVGLRLRLRLRLRCGAVRCGCSAERCRAGRTTTTRTADAHARCCTCPNK